MPDTKGRVTSIIMDKVQHAAISDSIRLQNLGIDPERKSEMIAAINNEFNIHITAEQAAELNDIGEVWILVEQLMSRS